MARFKRESGAWWLTPPACSSLQAGGSGEAERITVSEAENASLRELVAKLEASLAVLEWNLSRHSGNSGKLPSSDTVTRRRKHGRVRESRAERRQKACGRLEEPEGRDQENRRGTSVTHGPGRSCRRSTIPRRRRPRYPNDGLTSADARERVTGIEPA